MLWRPILNSEPIQKHWSPRKSQTSSAGTSPCIYPRMRVSQSWSPQDSTPAWERRGPSGWRPVCLLPRRGEGCLLRRRKRHPRPAGCSTQCQTIRGCILNKLIAWEKFNNKNTLYTQRKARKMKSELKTQESKMVKINSNIPPIM